MPATSFVSNLHKDVADRLEDVQMKLTKTQLKEMIRKVIRKKLSEVDLNERTRPITGVDKRMNQKELEKHLEKEKERSKQAKVTKKRQAAKQSARGMELESGFGIDRDVENEDASNDEEEEYLSKLEKLILQSEKEGRCK